MAKNEEKPCPEIFSSQKLKFSAKLVEQNVILTIILVGFFSPKMVQNFLFFAKNENAKKMETIVTKTDPKNLN